MVDNSPISVTEDVKRVLGDLRDSGRSVRLRTFDPFAQPKIVVEPALTPDLRARVVACRDAIVDTLARSRLQWYATRGTVPRLAKGMALMPDLERECNPRLPEIFAHWLRILCVNECAYDALAGRGSLGILETLSLIEGEKA